MTGIDENAALAVRVILTLDELMQAHAERIEQIEMRLDELEIDVGELKASVRDLVNTTKGD